LDHQVYDETYQGKGMWSSWALTQPGYVALISAPTVSPGQGALQVYAIGADDQIWTETSANNWHSWTRTQTSTAESLSVVDGANGVSSVFAIRDDLQVYVENSGKPYSPWQLTSGGIVGPGVFFPLAD
jgi:hypothetical protein